MKIMSFAHLKKTAIPSTGKKDEMMPLTNEGFRPDMEERDLVPLMAMLKSDENIFGPELVEDCWKWKFENAIRQGNIPLSFQCLKKPISKKYHVKRL